MTGTMTFSPWATLALAVPVLLLGEYLVKHIRVLSRFAIPAPVVSGLLVAVVVFALRETSFAFAFELRTAARGWTWLTTAEPVWRNAPVQSVHTPFLAAFFGCVGLSASWSLVRRAGIPVIVFLVLATVFAILQNLVGVGVAQLLGVSPLLGLVCGSMGLTGGHATALGFAAEFERFGLIGAQTLGTAAATFGLVSGAILAGPVGGTLIRRRNLATAGTRTVRDMTSHRTGCISDMRRLAASGKKVFAHLLVVALCLKAGAWISYLLQKSGLTFPVFIGTMIAGIVARNVIDAFGARWFDSGSVETISSIALAVFLAVAMMTLNLGELSAAAGPMLCILAVQVVLMASFAWWITFRLMGRDYDAAVIAGGHCGFGLGSTTTAIAGMKAIVENSGPAPRAFLIVPLVGGFLVDITNALNLTAFLNLLNVPR